MTNIKQRDIQVIFTRAAVATLAALAGFVLERCKLVTGVRQSCPRERV